MPIEKLDGLAAAIKLAHTKSHTIQAKYEQKIADLQTKLQPKTPPKFCAKRAAQVKHAQDSSFAAVTQCDQYLNEAMEIWAFFKNDSVMQQVRDTLSTKEYQFEEICIVSPTLVIMQQLSHVQEGRRLQGEIAYLHCKDYVLKEHM